MPEPISMQFMVTTAIGPGTVIVGTEGLIYLGFHNLGNSLR
jgi:hypothetical protein